MSLVSFLLSGALALAPAPPPTAYVDGVAAHLTEVQYRFHCGSDIALLAVHEQHLREGEVPRLADRRRITLDRLSIRGRPISPSDEDRLRRAFHELSWLDTVEARCGGVANFFELEVQGMAAEAWANYINDRSTGRPSLKIMTIRVSPAGAVEIH